MEPIYASREASLWGAASEEGGVTLPTRIVNLMAEHAAAEAAVKALPLPEDPVSPARLVDQGMDPAEAVAEADRRHARIAAWKREREALIGARSLKAAALNRAVDEHLEDLVLAARPVVTEIVEAARPLVPKLSGFAPAYESERIVARATAAELKAYQAVMALQVRLDVIHKAWTGSYVTPARVARTYEVSHSPAVFGWSAGEMGREHYYWAEPSLVRNPRLNGRALSRSGRPLAPSTSLLLIAAEPAEAGFRLATFPELRERAHQEWAAIKAAARGRDRVVAF